MNTTDNIQADIGVVGLAVMGRNLVLNMNDHGFVVAVFNRTTKKVDEFLSRGVNSVERKPFRPIRLLLLLMAVVIGFSLFSQYIPRWAGIY